MTRLNVNELSFVKRNEKGSVWLKREVPLEVLKSRKWWMYKPLKRFYVVGKSSPRLPERNVWPAVVGCISKGWDKPGARSKLLLKKK